MVKVKDPIIDFDHLRLFTEGDPDLERDVLGIFVEQADIWIRNLEDSRDKKSWADAAHTLKGSARGVGAWRIAEICERAEELFDSSTPTERSITLGDLRAAVAAAIQCIDLHLNALQAAE